MSANLKVTKLELKAMSDTIFEFITKDTDNLLKSTIY